MREWLAKEAMTFNSPQLQVAIRAAKEAGNYLVRNLGKVRKVREKTGPTDLVTEFDFAVQQKVIDLIGSEYPSHGIVAEEGTANREGSAKWIIDPIDGTTNYIHSYPFFSVSIAWMVDDKIEVGVVYAPILDELFAAVREEGAWLNERDIAVSRQKRLDEALLATGFPYEKKQVARAIEHFNSMVKTSRGIRRDGSAAIDLCYVAAGRIDGFWELGLGSWDIAAGWIIVEEAGGTVSTIAGDPYVLDDSDDILASNGLIHDTLTQMLK